jgi:hypothetical protein
MSLTPAKIPSTDQSDQMRGVDRATARLGRSDRVHRRGDRLAMPASADAAPPVRPCGGADRGRLPWGLWHVPMFDRARRSPCTPTATSIRILHTLRELERLLQRTSAAQDSPGEESPPARPATVLSVSRVLRLQRSLSRPHQGRRCRGVLSHVPCESRRSGSHHLRAGHHLASQRAPARLIPGSTPNARF